MKNITLAIDDRVLSRARRYAAKRNTTVNALVRQHLSELVDDQAAERLAAVAELERLAEEAGAVIGKLDWSRDDLHGRVWPREDVSE